MAGIPLLLSYDASWSCSRMRFAILLNSIRMITSDSVLGTKINAILEGSNNNVIELLKFSATLNIRLVTLNGQSIGDRVNNGQSINDSKLQLQQKIADNYQQLKSIMTTPTTMHHQYHNNAIDDAHVIDDDDDDDDDGDRGTRSKRLDDSVAFQGRSWYDACRHTLASPNVKNQVVDLLGSSLPYDKTIRLGDVCMYVWMVEWMDE